MTFGLTMEKMLLIALIAALIIGPDRLPRYAEGLRRFVGQAKALLRSTEGRVRDELGPEFTDTDWRQLDPRRFDPRRIVREALLAEPEPAPVTATVDSAPEAVASGAAAPRPVLPPLDASPAVVSPDRRDAAA